MKKIAFLLFSLFLLFAFMIGSDQQTAKAQVGKKYYYKKNTPLRGPHGHKWVWSKRREYVSVGLNINAMNYFGDITPRPGFWSTDLRFTRPNIAVFVQKKWRPQFSTRLAFHWGRLLSADTVTADPTNSHDVYRYIRNAHFRNDIFELSATMQLDLMSAERLNKEFYRRPKEFIPYLVGGVSVFYHNPKAKAPATGIGDDPVDWEPGEWTALRNLGTEGQGRGTYYTYNGVDVAERNLPSKNYSAIQVAFPLGIGVRKKISNRIDIAFEVSYRFLLTDYLDDVSKKYVDMSVFGDDNLARAFHDRSLEDNRLLHLQQKYQQGELAYLPNLYTYRGERDGREYQTFDGFGSDPYPQYWSIRGNSRDNDVYILTGFHFIYIIPPHGVRCPVRFR
ncbi:DUF6089 family protein [Hugenholtzia roseola]|uniref:DUF6089 family protein n=1 Tax=Hugenholtzia roseola TaxID=1002 RepID=UPI000401D09B|nr:DUF6089 family protein [Hugenholtzia roseola]